MRNQTLKWPVYLRGMKRPVYSTPAGKTHFMSKFDVGCLHAKTLKVELFSDSNLDDLQEQVNEFLYNIHPDDVKDVKLSSADGTYDILVIYKE